MPMILSSNVILFAYRSIAETIIFRLDVYPICSLYVKKEEWVREKITEKWNLLIQIPRIVRYIYSK